MLFLKFQHEYINFIFIILFFFKYRMIQIWRKIFM